MQSLSDIKALLAAHGLRPKHRHGQNFLIDPRKMEAVVAEADLRPGEVVLEVGPGTGALTERLLEAGATVLAVEIDRQLEPLLRERLAPHGQRFRLLLADVLDGKHAINADVIKALPRADRRWPNDASVDDGTGDRAAHEQSAIGDRPLRPRGPATPFKLVANLPYHVASPLLVNLCVDHPAMTRAVVMVQREVADRLTAAPGGPDYGPLSIMVQALCHADRVATLPPGCFWPPPAVDSAVVRLVRRDLPLAPDPHALSALAQRLFQKRRKQLAAILGRHAPLPPGFDPAARPQTLAIPQLVQLADWLAHHPG